MAAYKIGLVEILMGDILPSGAMGTALTPVGNTVADSPAFSATDPTKQDFNIEEQDGSVYSLVTSPAKETFSWSCYDVAPAVMVRFFGGTVTAGAAGAVATLGAIAGGSGYTNGTYAGVPLTGGAGSGATATITVAGGAVTSVVIVSKGVGYGVGNALSATVASLGGGAGTGFSVPVATIETSGGSWNAPDQIPEKEQSIKLNWKNGGGLDIPRAKVTAKLAFSFKKTALSAIDITASILQPTLAGVPNKIMR